MDKDKKAKARKSIVPRVRFARLKQLACFEEVKQMILDGYSASEVADFIQQERKEYTDITRNALISQIRGFRKTLKPGELVQNRLPATFIKAWRIVQKEIPELRELLLLYELQKERIKIDYEKEKQIGKLFATTVNEIREARKILRDAVDIKLDLGVIDRNLGKLSLEEEVIPRLENAAAQLGIPELKQVGLDPVRRRKLLDLFEKLSGLEKKL